MNELEESYNVFENIKHLDEFGEEYWNARELKLVLEYKEWRKWLKSVQTPNEKY